MQSPDALIGLYDAQGKEIGYLPRSEVDKREHTLKEVSILITSNDKIYMTFINSELWGPGWASSAAGLVRFGERSHDAAYRTAERELGLDTMLTSLGGEYCDFSGIKRHMRIYTAEAPRVHVNLDDARKGEWKDLSEVERLLKNSECVPTFFVAWNYWTRFSPLASSQSRR